MRGGAIPPVRCGLHPDTSVKLGGFLIVGLALPNQDSSIDGRQLRVNSLRAAASSKGG